MRRIGEVYYVSPMTELEKILTEQNRKQAEIIDALTKKNEILSSSVEKLLAQIEQITALQKAKKSEKASAR